MFLLCLLPHSNHATGFSLWGFGRAENKSAWRWTHLLFSVDLDWSWSNLNSKQVRERSERNFVVLPDWRIQMCFMALRYLESLPLWHLERWEVIRGSSLLGNPGRLDLGTVFKSDARTWMGVGTIHPKHDTEASVLLAEKGPYVGWDSEWTSGLTKGWGYTGLEPEIFVWSGGWFSSMRCDHSSVVFVLI